MPAHAGKGSTVSAAWEHSRFPVRPIPTVIPSTKGLSGTMVCIPAAFSAILIALLLCGCSVALNLKTVETAPKGQSRSTFGAGLWLTDVSAYYSDSASLSGSRGPRLEGGATYFFRYGVADNLELGFSADPPWPGVGGKLRLVDWAALDANVKLLFPVWETTPPPGFFYDASLILGGNRAYGGVKYLSDGMVPGSEGRSQQDAVLFAGRRFSHLIPEALFSLRHREGTLALGLMF